MKFITLPNGRQTSIPEYVRCWRLLKAMNPEREVTNWSWFPVPARDILREMVFGVHDRINHHLPWWPKVNSTPRTRKQFARLNHLVQTGKLVIECRWCGSPLKRYVASRDLRFCDNQCRRAHNS